MSNFPPNWQIMKIGQFAKRVKRKNHNHISDNVLTISANDGLISQKEFFNKIVASKDTSGYTLLENGEFAYNKSYSEGFPVGAARRLRKYSDGIVSPLYICFCINQEILDLKYADYLFNSQWFISAIYSIAKEGARSHGLLNIGINEFFDASLPIPTLPEQMKISKILYKIDQLLEKTRNQILKLQYLHKGLVSQFLSVGINDGISNETNVDFIPNGWCIKKIEEVSTFRRGSFPQPYGRAEWYDDNGYPFVQVYDIDENYKLKSTTKARISKLAAKKSVFIPKGSLIVSIQGSIGRVAITQYDAYVDRTILIFKNFENHFDKRFLSILIKELFLQQGQIADGGIIKTITKQTLSEFKVKQPPLIEQKKIAEIILTVASNIELKKRKLHQIQKTKQSLIQDLLSGRKRMNI